MLLKGRDLAFIGGDLEAPDGTKIAVAQSVVRGRKDQPKPALATAGDPPTATVTPPHQSRIRENAFMAGCGMDIVLQENGIAIMTMPALPQNAAGGRMHEGAMLRSEEHTSELQSLMRISIAVFCLKKKKT